MVQVFDFFSGCGGTSLGFQNFGFDIIGALDCDKDSAITFRHNFPKAQFIEQDIREVKPEDLNDIIKTPRKEALLFCGCAPCQPFTGQRRDIIKKDSRRNLLSEFQRFVEYWHPDFIFLENVPGLQKVNKSGGVFKKFTDALIRLGYDFDSSVVKASDIGIPQARKRFILIAALKNKKRGIKPLASIVNKYQSTPSTVREWISDLPTIQAGENHPTIPNHVAAKLSPQNLARIKRTPEGGDRRDWPQSLQVVCHKNYRGHSDVYGRMKWDAPAATLTTKCTSYSNGRFGHPEQDRAISVREAARLQTFPDNFIFHGSLHSCARQVGNAVPPLMAEKISDSFMLVHGSSK